MTYLAALRPVLVRVSVEAAQLLDHMCRMFPNVLLQKKPVNFTCKIFFQAAVTTVISKLVSNLSQLHQRANSLRKSKLKPFDHKLGLNENAKIDNHYKIFIYQSEVNALPVGREYYKE